MLKLEFIENLVCSFWPQSIRPLRQRYSGVVIAIHQRFVVIVHVIGEVLLG